MIDIHCHILPGIDDGAVDINQSMEMARHAVADGITHMVVTPHIQPGVYDNNNATISSSFDLFVVALREEKIKLNVVMAAEVRLSPEVLPMLKNNRIPLYIAPDGAKTMLLELPHSQVPQGTEQLIQWLLARHIQVLIAHPERNKEIMRNYNKVRSFVNMGCKLQITSGSVAGRFGEPSRVASEFMLQQGWVTVLASDAHNLKARCPELSEGVLQASRIIGKERAWALVTENAWGLVGGMFARE